MKMREINKEELKKIQLEILDYVSKYCKDNGINFFLDSGTLLGAVRHKGYIPWDDDIDIGMLREDYDKFIKNFNQTGGRYQFKSIETDKEFYYVHGKVLDTETTLYEPDLNGLKLSINIDVFAYDNAPESDKKVNKMFRKRNFYRNLSHLRTIKSKPRGNIVRRTIISICRFILKVFPKNYFILKMLKNAKKYSHKNTEKIGNFMGYARFCCEKSLFDKYIDMEFEGKKYPVPIGYDQWLKACYGDYMKLPPKEQQVTHHSFIAFMN